MDFISGETIGIDKPLGWTSFDVVKRLRGAIQRRLRVKKFKVGHAGTLDPLATGVLIVCTGRATRNIERLQEGSKEYVAEITLGATTPSFDLETEIDATFPWEHITRGLVDEVLPRFTGRVMQVPPVFSAVKVDGKRAYNLARKGKDVTLKAKPLEITTGGCGFCRAGPHSESGLQQRHIYPGSRPRFRRGPRFGSPSHGPQAHTCRRYPS